MTSETIYVSVRIIVEDFLAVHFASLGRSLTDLNAKNQPIEMISLAIFGDMTSQNFPLKKGTSHRIRIFPPGNGFNFKKKMSCYLQNRSS